VTQSLDRRAFLGSAAAAVAAGTLAGGLTPATSAASATPPAAPWIRRPRVATFAAVASANGIRGVNLAVEMMRDGADTLDAGVEGVKIQELDPEDTSVGYGGLPNEEGVVQLDASCMHGPTKRAGAVAALEGIKTPSEVARLVLKYTNHILLVGEGAKRFALGYGFREENLLTERARQLWLRWRANRGPNDDWLDVPAGEEIWTSRPAGTVNLNTINDKGEISSVTTTSGLAWKIPGRVGDSPIVGAGQYTDNEIGAAGSTGRGESNIMVCGGFLTVEFMRQGMSPTDACLATLRRVMAMTPPRLIDEAGKPRFNLTFYALNKRGVTGGASLFPGRYAAHDGREGRIHDSAYLYTR
jgi:N4-(beta-N-acetylglucosaminyl)-L-asparaginase